MNDASTVALSPETVLAHMKQNGVADVVWLPANSAGGGIRRLIGNRNFLSRMSSANSLTFDASGRANTRVMVTVGFRSDTPSGSTDA